MLEINFLESVSLLHAMYSEQKYLSSLGSDWGKRFFTWDILLPEVFQVLLLRNVTHYIFNSYYFFLMHQVSFLSCLILTLFSHIQPATYVLIISGILPCIPDGLSSSCFVSFCFLLPFLVQALWRCLINICWMNEQRDMFLTFSICCFMLLLTFMYIQTLSSLRSIMLASLFSCKVVSDSFVTSVHGIS